MVAVKELIVHCSDEFMGFVEVASHHTLADLRGLMADEFDDDMLPSDYYFTCNGIRFSTKQESKRNLWDLIEKGVEVCVSDKSKKRPSSTNVDNDRDSAKKQRVEERPPAKEKSNRVSITPSNRMSELNKASVQPLKSIPRSPIEVNVDSSNEEEDLFHSPLEEATELETSESNLESLGDREEEDLFHSTYEDSTDDTPFFSTDSLHTDNTPKSSNVSTKKPASNSKSPPTSATKALTFLSPTKASAASPRSSSLPEKASTPEFPTMPSSPLSPSSPPPSPLDEVITEEEEGTQPPKEDSNAAQQEAMKKSCQVLNEMQRLLNDNPLLCSKERRDDLYEEIREQLASTAPHVVIGVLGSTGVGKSSLLNALLDEAEVLPTSGSRGCTATVVELRFNQELAHPPEGSEKITVYNGKVEFMKPQDWEAELRVLVDECSTLDTKTIYARPPDAQSSPDASASWAKINQVYGEGTMEKHKGEPKDTVIQRLLRDHRVNSLLTPKEGEEYNAILVKEGEIEAAAAKLLLNGFDKLTLRMRRSVKKWAHNFRRKINDYVYRKGNGNGPQTWPLIRCVTLHGPWNVLSTGACLVDLPGVRDANAARARVAERYLQNCSQIWVVAPIKRAVDDGTAKELMGEQFKRRLLMDGQYGNVSFICTQTDDCEATEIMRDHQDIALLKPGRWEKMTELLDGITQFERELADLQQEEEDLKTESEAAFSDEEELKATEILEVEEDDDENSCSQKEEMDKLLNEARQRVSKAFSALHSWRETNLRVRSTLQRKSHKWQRDLKSRCATVRNEYSTSYLKEDFINGLKDLYQNEDGRADSGDNSMDFLDSIDLPVFCISANDYLKIQGIKPSTDGPPNTFSVAKDTQLPSLRSFVQETTAQHRSHFYEMFANQVSDHVDRVKLIATGTGNGGGTRLSRRCRDTFETAMLSLEHKVKPIAENFRRLAEAKVGSTLQPSLKTGAAKGHTTTLQTVASWGSKSVRTKYGRGPDCNGLRYPTYQATCRRDGVYFSPAAGPVDFNQELCDPMEKEFSPAWQSIMDSALRLLIADCETKIQAICGEVDRALIDGLVRSGMCRSRLASLATAASRSCSTAVKGAFSAIRQVASDCQRDLNRSLLPKVQERMKGGYDATQCVQRGTGTFVRMKSALIGHANHSVSTMFDECTNELLQSICQLIERISGMITLAVQTVRKALEGVYSLCWDDQSEIATSKDPALQQKVRDCRDKLLPDLSRLRDIQDLAMNILGMEREELELDVLAVDSWEQQQAKKLQEAIEKGELIDLCDSSDEEASPSNAKPPSLPMMTMPAKLAKVKSEPRNRLSFVV